MSLSSRRSPGRLAGAAALILVVLLLGQVLATVASAGPVAAAHARQDVTVARRAYFVGTSDEIRQRVLDLGAGHNPGDERQKELAEYGTPPPPCGRRLQKLFIDYCAAQLKVGIAPCTSADSYALCSTDYLAPANQKVYWRLRYRHSAQDLALEVEAVQRGETGRLLPAVEKRAGALDQLFDLLLKATRCEDTP